jgi:hypothetical protein
LDTSQVLLPALVLSGIVGIKPTRHTFPAALLRTPRRAILAVVKTLHPLLRDLRGQETGLARSDQVVLSNVARLMMEAGLGSFSRRTMRRRTPVRVSYRNIAGDMS